MVLGVAPLLSTGGRVGGREAGEAQEGEGALLLGLRRVALEVPGEAQAGPGVGQGVAEAPLLRG